MVCKTVTWEGFIPIAAYLLHPFASESNLGTWWALAEQDLGMRWSEPNQLLFPTPWILHSIEHRREHALPQCAKIAVPLLHNLDFHVRLPDCGAAKLGAKRHVENWL